jgi:hypothetical protein
MANPIAQADNGDDTAINIRSSRYCIAHTVGRCWHCDAPTPLVALALPPGHEALEWDDDARDDEGLSSELPRDQTSRDMSGTAAHAALLFYVEYIPEAVGHRLKALVPSYRFGYSEAVAGCYWANHCERCGSLQDDHELFCEPDGAFLPTTETSARLVHLLPVHEAIEVGAAGYAYDPPFFDAVSDG